MFVTDLSYHLELVIETGGGRETGESERRVLTYRAGSRVCVCMCAFVPFIVFIPLSAVSAFFTEGRMRGSRC